MTTLPKNATSFDYTRFTFAHDFILNDKPCKFCRESDGSPQLAVGATLLLPYGVGYVEKRTGDRTYLVRVVDVDDSWTQSRRSGEITAREYIQERNERITIRSSMSPLGLPTTSMRRSEAKPY